MFLDFAMVVGGGIFIILLAEWIIHNTELLAHHWGLSGTFVGMTILSIGTSLPEIFTHIIGSVKILQNPAMMNEISSLVIGASIGSDIFQQNFIFGIVAILGAILFVRKEIKPIIGGLICGASVLLLFSFNGFVSRIEGLVLVLGYVGYLFYLHYQGFNHKVEAKDNLSRKNIFRAVLFLFLAFILMAFAASMVLESSENLIHLLPISASFFGIIVLGVVAGLPELTTAFVAIRKNRKGMSAGVLIGSNITNPTFALGLGALISSYAVPNVVNFLDLPFHIFTSLVVLVFLLTRKEVSKVEGSILIALFFVFLFIRNIYFPVDIF